MICCSADGLALHAAGLGVLSLPLVVLFAGMLENGVEFAYIATMTSLSCVQHVRVHVCNCASA